MSLYDARKELADVVRGCGLYVDEEGLMTDSFEAPAALIDFELTGDLVFQQAAHTMTGHVWILAPRTEEKSSGRALDAYRDPSSTDSVWRQINDHVWTYGNGNGYMRAVEASRIQAIGLGNAEYLMVDITLEVVL